MLPVWRRLVDATTPQVQPAGCNLRPAFLRSPDPESLPEISSSNPLPRPLCVPPESPTVAVSLGNFLRNRPPALGLRAWEDQCCPPTLDCLPGSSKRCRTAATCTSTHFPLSSDIDRPPSH